MGVPLSDSSDVGLLRKSGPQQIPGQVVTRGSQEDIWQEQSSSLGNNYGFFMSPVMSTAGSLSNIPNAEALHTVLSGSPSASSQQTLNISVPNNNSPSAADIAAMEAQAAQQAREPVDPNMEEGGQLYKTQLCRYYKTKGWCAHGETCVFAHGDHELRIPRCRYFDKYGNCKNGHVCKFAHITDEDRELGLGLEQGSIPLDSARRLKFPPQSIAGMSVGTPPFSPMSGLQSSPISITSSKPGSPLERPLSASSSGSHNNDFIGQRARSLSPRAVGVEKFMHQNGEQSPVRNTEYSLFGSAPTRNSGFSLFAMGNPLCGTENCGGADNEDNMVQAN